MKNDYFFIIRENENKGMVTILCKDCLKQREIPDDKYNYLYEMRTLCVMNNMIFLQCDSCKRVDIVNIET